MDVTIPPTMGAAIGFITSEPTPVSHRIGIRLASTAEPPYNVILENDDYHSQEFVIDVLRKVLGCSNERAYLFMYQAHTTGRAIIWTRRRRLPS